MRLPAHYENRATFNITNDSFAPRISVNWDPRTDAKTMLFASWGRYYGNTFLAPLVDENGPDEVVTVYGLDPSRVPSDTNQGVVPDSLVDSSFTVRMIDRGLEQQRNDEWSIGVEREIAQETAVKLRYVNRRYSDQLQDTDINKRPITYDEMRNRPPDIYPFENPGGGGRADCPTVKGFYELHGAVHAPDQLRLARDAELRADALASGDGGKVVVWSDGDTRLSGAISARGGALAGNGGVAETSGKQNLAFDGTVDLGAPNGSAATLLLDSQDINLVDGPGAGADDSQVGPGDGTIARADGGLNNNFTISKPALEAVTGTISLQADRDITVAGTNTLNLANQTSGESVTFNANDDIAITDGGNANFTISKTALQSVNGNISLQASRDISVSGVNTLNLANQALRLGMELIQQIAR